jgi:formylglycine-generating enzyme required for sulfatase activity
MKRISLLFILVGLGASYIPGPGTYFSSKELFYSDSILYRIMTTRQSVSYLVNEFGASYKEGKKYLKELEGLEKDYKKAKKIKAGESMRSTDEKLRILQRIALLNSPVIDFEKILLVNRLIDSGDWVKPSLELKSTKFGFPSNHECNSSLDRNGYDNELCYLTDIGGTAKLTTLYAPENREYIGEVDLHWESGKILFTKSDSLNWKVWEMDLETGRVRQVSQTPEDVDCFDATYLPDGRVVFGSTANYQSVPCWHGLRKLSNLYLMDSNGGNMRRLCFDQDLDMHPTVMQNGQVLFNRWDYTGINHIFLRQQMAMNPDGTAQRAIYGSNSWFPNSLYFSREIPGHPGKLVSILSGYHGIGKMGQLVILDTQKGWHEEKGLVKRISGRGDPIEPKYYDNLVDNDWPKFTTPFPLDEHYHLVSCWNKDTRTVGVYLADAFDNLVLIKEIPGRALLEPIPLRKSVTPPMIPDRIKPNETEATVFINNIYDGPGLEGVPVGTIRCIRVIAYHFGYMGLAGPDLIGYGGPWEVMRILGTTPVQEDGSALFKIPANVPVAFQMLDNEGRAVQLMRSWVTAMPGEFASCVGCHESPGMIAPVRKSIAALSPPLALQNWYGEERGFDFEREVQPVLDKYCISCHNGGNKAIFDLRSEKYFPHYKGKILSPQEVSRMHPDMLEATRGHAKYTPAYDVLIHYIRRVLIEDDVSLLIPGEYHADTSPLVQLLKKNHHGVNLSKEAWDRLYTWIDLNGPCHGTWNDVFPIPDQVCERRTALDKIYGGPATDPEYIPVTFPLQNDLPYVSFPPLTETNVSENSQSAQTYEPYQPELKQIELGKGITLTLTKVPAGSFRMGNRNGYSDEKPEHLVCIPESFWIATTEITNAQFRAFKMDHDSRYYSRRHERADDKGITLNNDNQPVVKVSWNEAMEFCEWLSAKTGTNFSLPTEAQWEYASTAGSEENYFRRNKTDDFSTYANLADRSFGYYIFKSGYLQHMVLEGAGLADTTINDKFVVTADVGSASPNPWGIYDMIGNAAEWVLNDYGPYPFNNSTGHGNKVVRGGSFFDPPRWATSTFRLNYPPWQRVFNVGFRVTASYSNL